MDCMGEEGRLAGWGKDLDRTPNPHFWARRDVSGLRVLCSSGEVLVSDEMGDACSALASFLGGIGMGWVAMAK